MSNYKKWHFLSGKGFGLFFIWGCVAMLFLAFVATMPFLGKAQVILGVMTFAALAITTLVYAGVFITSLVKRQWKKSVIMFLLGGVGTVLFAIGFGVAMAIHFGALAQTWEPKDEKPRLVGMPNAEGTIVFSVEYTNVHPFLAEYDKYIVFSSGKRIGIWMDTGGAGPFAVYLLPDGSYYLVDGLDADFLRNDYRINVTHETVEMLCGETWVQIPDNTLRVCCRSGDSISVETAKGDLWVDSGTPVGASLNGRIYQGLIYPNGTFVPGEGDPFVETVNSR